ncbi:IpaD/SipD/SspD family type III secretion system needle tip protein [Rouxiella sp. T17]|uniref:IpaD/SipD/SspD family type III secretion system needle tip protein n=1 Tax=Rouxiella sp. T17 TaxID=3085684 RepID=UPI002FCA8465
MQISNFPGINSKPLLNVSYALQIKESSFTSESLTIQTDSEVKPQTDALKQAIVDYQKFNSGPDKSNAQFVNHLLKQNVLGLDAQLESVKAFENKEFAQEHGELMTALKQNLANTGISEFAPESKGKNISDSIGDIIGNVKESYYDVFEGAVAKYIQFYKELSAILAKMGNWTDPSDKEGNVKFKFKTLRDELVALKNRFYGSFEILQLYPSNVSKNTSEADAKKWAKDMGLPASSVKLAANKKDYYVTLDMSPLETMINKMIYVKENDKDPTEVTNTVYQAWLTGFNAQEEQIKTTISSLTGRFSNANSIYDNVVKILSSTIASLADMSKRYFSF